MRTFVVGFAAAAGLSVATAASAQDWENVPVVRHAELQGVNASGAPTYSGGFPLRVQGVLLCDPGDVFDDTPNFIPFSGPGSLFQFGARQQPYVQAVDPNDSGGTALFLAQCVGNHPANQDTALSYTNDAWLAELDRTNFDADTGHRFQAGDLVEVRARIGLHFSGKFNINEAHSINPANDYEIVLIQAGFGLPEPTAFGLPDVFDDAGEAIFDETRQTGGEAYQATRVELVIAEVLDASNWSASGTITVTDGTRTMEVLVGSDPAFNTEPAPSGEVRIRGIFDQEASPSPIGGQNGYRLVLVNPDEITHAADLDFSSTVNTLDLIAFINEFRAGEDRTDLNRDGSVNTLDLIRYINLFRGV